MSLKTFFSSFFGGQEVQNSASSSSLAELLNFPDIPTTAGVQVTAGTSMRHSAVFACVRLVSSAVASTPLHVYRRGEGQQRELASHHQLETVLGQRPNRYMTAATFWRYLMTSKILLGNAYAYIMRDRNGVVQGMYPIDPRNVTPYYAWEIGLDQRLGAERNRRYYYMTWPDGKGALCDQDDVFHVPNVGFDGLRGMSTIRAAAQSIGLGLAAEQSSASYFEHGMASQLVFVYPERLDPQVAVELARTLERNYSGPQNHHRPLFLSQGGDVKSLAISASDAQLIESRRFSVTDICRWFGVPPVMIGESEKTTSFGSGVEQMARWFVTFTLNDHFVAIEQEMSAKLFRHSPFFAEFDESELTRGDTKTRGDYYRIARGSMQEPGFMTINEIRAAEGLPPVPDGDEIQQVTINQPIKAQPESGALPEGQAETEAEELQETGAEDNERDQSTA